MEQKQYHIREYRKKEILRYDFICTACRASFVTNWLVWEKITVFNGYEIDSEFVNNSELCSFCLDLKAELDYLVSVWQIIDHKYVFYSARGDSCHILL